MIKAYCKRVLLFIPFVLCYFLVLGIAMMSLVIYASEFLFENKTDSIVSVAVYVPGEEAYSKLGLNLVKQMDSVKHTIDIDQIKSKSKVVRMVEEGEAVAGIIVPEGFMEKMGTPDSLQVQIIYRDADTFEEHIVNDVVYAMSDILGTTQCTILTAGEYAEQQLGMDQDGVYDVKDAVTSNLFDYVMDRKTAFRKVNLDDLVAKYDVKFQLAASYTLYIIMMSIFVISFFYKGNNAVFRARAKLSGIGTWKLFLIESACAAFMMYILYVLIFVSACFIFDSMKVLSLITIIPVILIVALIGTGLCYLVRSPSTVSYIMFGAGTSLMYLAGGLIPLDFMPRFFQNAAAFNPLHYLILFFMRSMFL